MYPFYRILIVLLWLPSCRQGALQVESKTAGYGSLVDDLIVTPKPKSAESLRQFFHNLKQSLSKSVSHGASASLDSSLRKEATRGVFLQQIKEAQGIPRPQGEILLMNLASDATGNCGGASCSMVMGMTARDVPEFLDETYAKAASNVELAKPKNKSLRDTLLGSLVRLNIYKPKLAPATAQAHIAAQQAVSWPSAAIKPEQLLAAKEIMKILPKSERMAVTNYTITGFQDIRLFQNSSNRELIAQGWSKEEIKQATYISKTIDTAIGHLPTLSSPVYRGINQISPNEVAYFVWCWQHHVPIGLGPKNLPAVASATWDPNIAKDFIRSKWDPSWDNNYGILLVIKGDHGGAAIENISYVEKQREVLLPSWASFDIEKISPVKNEERMLVMELRAKRLVGPN